MGHSDAKLVALTLEQGSQFFGKLVKRHTDYLYGLGMRLTAGNDAQAKDLAQQSFIRAFNYLRNFNPKHPALGQDPNNRFRNWLTGIAVNCFKDMAAKEVRYSELEDTQLNQIPQPTAQHSSDEFAKMIQSLTVTERQIVTLRFVYEYTIEEISGMLGLKSGTVKSKLSRAVARLRSDLAEADASGQSATQAERDAYERV